MTIEHKLTNKSTVVLILNGRLDTANAPLLEQKIRQWGDDISRVVLDFAGLTYISSMGLRVLLQAKKELKQQSRSLVIKNMGASVKEVFEMTGFLSLMVHDEKFVIIRKNVPATQNTPETVVLSLNGEMQEEHIETITKELSEIRDSYQLMKVPVMVILDMEKLTRIEPGTGLLLQEAAEKTSWEKRNLCLRNVSTDMQAVLRQEHVNF